MINKTKIYNNYYNNSNFNMINYNNKLIKHKC